MKPDADLEQALAKIDEEAGRGLRRMRNGVGVWIVGALCAVVTCIAVLYALKGYRTTPKPAPATKPVPILIVPSQAPAR